MSENVIELKNVRKEFVTTKHYPGFKGAVKGLFTKETDKKIAVDDVSFSIKEGEMVGYIGSNGAGKSTTIKMMSGILTPTDGIISDFCRTIYKNNHAVKGRFFNRTWWIFDFTVCGNCFLISCI